MKRNWKRNASWLLATVIAVLLGAVLAAGSLERREQKRMRICKENLWKIDGAKEQWALENNVTAGALPTVADLDGTGYMKPFPRCPSGHSYQIEVVGSDPVCPSGLPGHDIHIEGDITSLEGS